MNLPKSEHEEKAPKILNFALITVSSSRYMARLRGEPFSDESQEIGASIIQDAGHVVRIRDLVDDNVDMIRSKLRSLLEDEDLDVIIFIGGTGFSKKDVTIEAVKPLFEREVEGFGELFRWLSFQEIGAAAALSRATMGVVKDKAVICLPGSPHAVDLALRKFLGELPHLIYILRS